MKLAKRLITFSLAAALSLSLAACGGGSGGSTPAPPPPPRHYPTCRLLLRHGAHQADDGHLPLC